MLRPFYIVSFFLALSLTSFFSPALAHVPDYVNEKINAGLWDAKRALHDIAAQLSFGSRALDTPGHERAIRYIEDEAAKIKSATVLTQQWVDTGAETADDQGSSVMGWMKKGPRTPPHALVNIVVRFAPENPRRMIIGTHYDSIGRAYRDAKRPDAVMPGANNSASGVALLLETARALGQLPPPPVGVDLVFFDGEEGPYSLGAGDPHWHALGSPYFAKNLLDFYPDHAPEQAVIFDMVCYKKLALYMEPLSYSSARPEVLKFWETGRKIAPSIFKTTPYPSPIDDDHNAFALLGIPSFLVIGFDYEPYFNTTQDTLDKCSAATLDAMGRTLIHYIYNI